MQKKAWESYFRHYVIYFLHKGESIYLAHGWSASRGSRPTPILDLGVPHLVPFMVSEKNIFFFLTGFLIYIKKTHTHIKLSYCLVTRFFFFLKNHMLRKEVLGWEFCRPQTMTKLLPMYLAVSEGRFEQVLTNWKPVDACWPWEAVCRPHFFHPDFEKMKLRTAGIFF